MVKLTTTLGKWEKVVYALDAIPGNLYKLVAQKQINDIVLFCVSGTFSPAFVRLSTATIFKVEDSDSLTLLPPGTKATLEQEEG